MIEYPKIDGPFVRDPKGKVILGQWRLPEFEYLKDNLWAWTEKIDGTNIRIGWDGEKVEFGGRSADSQMRTDLLIRLQELFPPEKFGRFARLFSMVLSKWFCLVKATVQGFKKAEVITSQTVWISFCLMSGLTVGGSKTKICEA